VENDPQLRGGEVDLEAQEQGAEALDAQQQGQGVAERGTGERGEGPDPEVGDADARADVDAEARRVTERVGDVAADRDLLTGLDVGQSLRDLHR